MVTIETFPGWLERQLQRREWTQADLARKSGLSQGRISDWLAGKRLPNPDSCDRLADALDADVDHVLMLAGHRPDTGILDRDPVKRELVALLRRATLDEERASTLRAILSEYVRLNRVAKR